MRTPRWRNLGLGMGHCRSSTSTSTPPIEITTAAGEARVSEAPAMFPGHWTVVVPHFGIALAGRRTKSPIKRRFGFCGYPIPD
ncbi:MAG TPA: hypothetical protein VKE42_00225, partial [Candidatus Cybelea sp.]|nr:hypothetical protein [Candidatus Cybelea sp.]